MSDEFVFDPDTITIGELEDFEEIVGQPFQQAFSDPQAVSAKALKAVVWILRRREDPEAKLEDVRDVRMQAVKLRSPEKDSDPTDAASAS